MVIGTPGQDSAADSAMCSTSSRLAASVGPATASTSTGASDATLIRCKLRCRPTLQEAAVRRGRAALAIGSADFDRRWGRAAASGLSSVTPPYRNVDSPAATDDLMMFSPIRQG